MVRLPLAMVVHDLCTGAATYEQDESDQTGLPSVGHQEIVQPRPHQRANEHHEQADEGYYRE
jgi:hypothetical protein